MAAENTAWTLGSHVYGWFWDNHPRGSREITEYVVIHRTRHFATVQLLSDRTVVYRKRVHKKDGEFLPVNIGAFWLRPDKPVITPSDPALCDECASSSPAAEPASSSPGPVASG